MGDSVRSADEFHGNHCLTGSEEDRQVCDSGDLPSEDSCETSHKGRQEDDLWQGGSCQGQASKDNCESVSCGRPQAKHLSSKLILMRPQSGNPMEAGQEAISCMN